MKSHLHQPYGIVLLKREHWETHIDLDALSVPSPCRMSPRRAPRQRRINPSIATSPNSAWTTLRRLDGDQTNQGRQLSVAPHQVHAYRVVLFSIEQY